MGHSLKSPSYSRILFLNLLSFTECSCISYVCDRLEKLSPRFSIVEILNKQTTLNCSFLTMPHSAEGHQIYSHETKFAQVRKLNQSVVIFLLLLCIPNLVNLFVSFSLFLYIDVHRSLPPLLDFELLLFQQLFETHQWCCMHSTNIGRIVIILILQLL